MKIQIVKSDIIFEPETPLDNFDLGQISTQLSEFTMELTSNGQDIIGVKAPVKNVITLLKKAVQHGNK